MPELIRGRIKSIKKNYGFIGGEDSKDYFFHWTFLSKDTKTFNQLSIGNTVQFVPTVAEDKLCAKNVVALD